eukprot:scaffold24016_cov25-Prasinocladus_malaysianus.AAC.1
MPGIGCTADVRCLLGRPAEHSHYTTPARPGCRQSARAYMFQFRCVQQMVVEYLSRFTIAFHAGNHHA